MHIYAIFSPFQASNNLFQPCAHQVKLLFLESRAMYGMCHRGLFSEGSSVGASPGVPKAFQHSLHSARGPAGEKMSVEVATRWPIKANEGMEKAFFAT